MRTYQPRAYAVLPYKWTKALAEEYLALGYEVQTGEYDDERGWVRIKGITRTQLYQHLNDPLGEPGKQETRHPRSGRYRRKVKPIHPEGTLERELEALEASYGRPD